MINYVTARNNYLRCQTKTQVFKKQAHESYTPKFLSHQPLPAAAESLTTVTTLSPCSHHVVTVHCSDDGIRAVLCTCSCKFTSMYIFQQK